MSTTENTPDAEPLHLATLLAVLAKLRDRLTAIPALIAEDTADHPLTDVETAEWNARVEALEGFAADVALMLKDANPRARVVVLPEAPEPDEDGQVYFDDGDIRVDTTGSDDPAAFPNVVWYRGIEYTPKHAYELGLELVAAGIAGGAQ